MKEKCKGSSVEITGKKIVINGVEHGGGITHTCYKDHDDHTRCECVCGYVWVKNFK